MNLWLANEKTGSYWIGLSQDMSSGAIESWANGFPVLFTHWAKSHTGNSLYSWQILSSNFQAFLFSASKM
jgi:hypothetical protein